MNLKKVGVISLTFLTISFMGILMCVGLLFGEDSEGNRSSGTSPGGTSVSEEVLKHRAMVEKCAKESDITEYIPILLAIIQVESGGTMEDVMQSSESAGLPPNSLSTEASIKQGCLYFASLVKRSKELGCDQDSIIQAYNYGGGYLDHVGKNGKKHSFALAESFSKEKSGGQKVDYPNPIAIKENGGWRYNYGNMFYCLLVKQYLTTTQFDDKIVQEIFDEAFKYEGTAYVFGGSSPETGFDCSGLTQWCYAKVDLKLPRVAQDQYDAMTHIDLKDAKPGDLVFFHSTYDAGTYVTHVGIYAGENRMFHAGDPVGWTNLTENYWRQHLIGAGRYK
ncbi:bifunctional lysozyme/C40 family peptidase [Enterococcus faecium]|uniref:bifunctional lytic transglycosylase/C40 family peptidase n=1 Tax=Enterococcus faecium TaxID=1352 RepID=UPI001CDBC41E|nr:bifunctional lysozyme/C40 family peptidase [Enterococcus faecium]EKZ0499187.1 bifunctional lysozyme/C40 family peptidase [Enterococcus faecium]UBU70231.1 bifunctional lysozyme/C40 family peptidase [Enterococcus faecium]HAP8158832.1 peptidase P60 [Enterococcus faecium]HAP8211779.1 peptidase P60 [Enterococcus faecium]HDL0869337.1 bifunctional lysozyme/C40 family peptidase [Enterococcus faecium]